MGQLSLAMDGSAAAVSRQHNVVPFDTLRRTTRVRTASTDQPRVSEGVVVRLPLANGGHGQKSPGGRASDAMGQAGPSTGEPRFTTFDFIATAFLILSVFSGPALVWSLLRSASLG